MIFFFSCSIQLGQPATVKVAANLVRLISYNNKVHTLDLIVSSTFLVLALIFAYTP